MSGKNKLALGTVQFGLDYGISNKGGKVLASEVDEILDTCKANGINMLDTAQAYGDSQKVLGQFDLSGFDIVSKMMKNSSVEKSLEELNISKLYAMMLHREDEMDETSFKTLSDAKSQGLVEKIGISVYSPQKLQEIIDNFEIDIVQLPMNIIDQRFINILKKLKQKKLEVHTRSAFLQGLLLMDIKSIDAYFDEIKPVLQKIPSPKLSSCLSFLRSQHEVDRIVFGVTKKQELIEIIENYKNPTTIKDTTSYAVSKEKYINPSLWNIQK